MRKTAAQLANMVLAKVANESPAFFSLPEGEEEYPPERSNAALKGLLAGGHVGGILGSGVGAFNGMLDHIDPGMTGAGRGSWRPPKPGHTLGSAIRGGALGAVAGALPGLGLGALLQHFKNKDLEEAEGPLPERSNAALKGILTGSALGGVAGAGMGDLSHMLGNIPSMGSRGSLPPLPKLPPGSRARFITQGGALGAVAGALPGLGIGALIQHFKNRNLED